MILQFWEIVFHNKIFNKVITTKYQDNSAHCFGESYLRNHFMKFLQDWIKPCRVGALRVSTGYNFFQTNSLVEASYFALTHHVIYVKAYRVTVIVNTKSIYLNRLLFSRVSFAAAISENYDLLL